MARSIWLRKLIACNLHNTPKAFDFRFSPNASLTRKDMKGDQVNRGRVFLEFRLSGKTQRAIRQDLMPEIFSSTLRKLEKYLYIALAKIPS